MEPYLLLTSNDLLVSSKYIIMPGQCCSGFVDEDRLDAPPGDEHRENGD
jgi:hypothetical protein